jgi:hypothetical protein
VDEAERAGVEQIDCKIAIGDCVKRVRKRRGHAQVGGYSNGIERQAGTRERSCAERRNVGCSECGLETTDITLQAPHVGSQMMRKRDRLGSLKVREGGQDRRSVDLRTIDEDCLQVGGPLNQRECVRATPETKSGCHLIVPGAPGVYATTDIAQLGDQLALNQGMHVLVASSSVDHNDIERLHNRSGVVSWDNALTSEHPRMRFRRRNVVRQESLIDVERL